MLYKLHFINKESYASEFLNPAFHGNYFSQQINQQTPVS